MVYIFYISAWNDIELAREATYFIQNLFNNYLGKFFWEYLYISMFLVLLETS